jgi:hypothetical protein
MKITFTDTKDIPSIYYPRPASENIPEWYKKMNSYVGDSKNTDGKGISLGTLKKCMPVFDVITAGYILVTPADILVKQIPDENGIKTAYYEWSHFDLIEFHSVLQAPTHPHKNEHVAYPKFINPWGIQTPKGYSTLFIQPVHRESVFTIFPGLVDTDKYIAPINFPFVLNDSKFEGLIPAGTPIVQVIPVKRENWKMEIGDEQELEKIIKVGTLNKTLMFDKYKNLFRTKKEYK